MRIIAIIIAMVFSMQCFAAVVSDNDGSAFITKAEFDSLKNAFQAQIDQYNTSIDSKIDGAIAAYLAGIKSSRKYSMDNIYNQFGGNNIKWFKNANLWVANTN